MNWQLTFVVALFAIIVTIGIAFEDALAVEVADSIPPWFKGVAGFWAQGDITDSEFINGVEYLIEQKIIRISNYEQVDSQSTQTDTASSGSVPPWFKGVAGFWAQGNISNSEFVDGIKFLIEQKVITSPNYRLVDSQMSLEEARQALQDATSSTSPQPITPQPVDCSLRGPGVNLQGCDLSGANLSDANLSGADLSNAKLHDVDFSGANLSDANLSGADLYQSNLNYADLTNVNFSGVEFELTSTEGANFSGANFDGAWIHVSFTDCIGKPTGTPARGNLPICGSGPSPPPVDCSLRGPGVNLQGCSFVGANLSGIDFSGANLSGADLYEAKLIGTILTNADLTGAELWGADLTRAILTNADFTGTEVSVITTDGCIGTPKGTPAYGEKIVCGTTQPPTPTPDSDGDGIPDDVDQCKYEAEHFNGFEDADGCPDEVIVTPPTIPTPTPTIIPPDRCSLRGPGVDLNSCDLSGENLSGADLRNANLRDIVLKNANLSGANLAGADMSPIIHGSRLNDANLSGADLSGTDFTGATLLGADLSRTNLDGTILTNADLSGVTYDGCTGTPTGTYTHGEKIVCGSDSSTQPPPPTPDSDGDGMDDDNDNCPNEAENYNAWFDDDGCPEDKRTLDCNIILYAIGWPLQPDLRASLNEGCQLAGADLSGYDLSGRDLSYATFWNAQDCSLELYELCTNLADAILTNTNFYRATVNHADFTGTTFTGANLEDASMIGSKFVESIGAPRSMRYTDVSSADFWFSTGWPTGEQQCIGDGLLKPKWATFTCAYDDLRDWRVKTGSTKMGPGWP